MSIESEITRLETAKADIVQAIRTNLGQPVSESATLDALAEQILLVAHASTHAAGGSDPLTPADIGAASASHTLDESNPHSVTAAQVGLGNVDNTSDADKPISAAVQTALNGKANITHTHSEYANASHTHSDATTSASGFMSATDKATLDKKPGKTLTGETLSTTSSTTAVAGTGAEIFNDYSDRTYDPSGVNTPTGNVATGEYSHAEGSGTTSSGACSSAEGAGTIASGEASHAEGNNTTASGEVSHAEGAGTTASNTIAHAEGGNTTASGYGSHSEGYGTTASGDYSHAEGQYTEAIGAYSHAGGHSTEAIGKSSFVTGYYSEAYNYGAGFGIYNDGNSSAALSGTTGTLFTIGNGTSESNRKNVFRVSQDGKCRGASSWVSSGADYAEMFEWLDGNENNEDRRGLFVALDGEKVRLATSADDYILGVISADPVVLGDHSDDWHARYITDVFGAKITETKTNEEDVEVQAWVINPEYDPEQEYIGREHRKEWAQVGMLGKLVIVDDGTCTVNSYCYPSANGIATASETGYRVMKRIDDTHVRVLIK